jgi:hypothetical protein
MLHTHTAASATLHIRFFIWHLQLPWTYLMFVSFTCISSIPCHGRPATIPMLARFSYCFFCSIPHQRGAQGRMATDVLSLREYASDGVGVCIFGVFPKLRLGGKYLRMVEKLGKATKRKAFFLFCIVVVVVSRVCIAARSKEVRIERINHRLNILPLIVRDHRVTLLSHIAQV